MSKDILVYVEQRAGVIQNVGFELCGEARRLAKNVEGAKVVALVIGDTASKQAEELRSSGEVAIRHALRYPKDVERLVLANTAAWTSNWLRDIGHAWNKVGETLDGDAYYDLAIPVIYSSKFYQEKEEWMENRRKVLVPLFSTNTFQDRMKRLVDSSESHDLRSEIHKIKHETLVISSLYDNLTPLCEQEFLVKEMKNAHHVILPNCGHASMYEDPLLFISLVLGFANAKDTKYVI